MIQTRATVLKQGRRQRVRRAKPAKVTMPNSTADFLDLLRRAPIDRLSGMARRPDQIPSLIMYDFAKSTLRGDVYLSGVLVDDTAAYLAEVYPTQLTLPEMIYFFTCYPGALRDMVWVVSWLDEDHDRWMMAMLERLPNEQVELYVGCDTPDKFHHPESFCVPYKDHRE